MAGDLTIQFECLTRGGGAEAACGVVITDPRTARAIHEAGYYLDPAPTVQAAGFAALLKAMEVAEAMTPESLDMRCGNELLVRQLTAQATVTDEREMTLFEQAITALLRLDSWRITAVDSDELRRASDLAQRALDECGGVSELHADDAARLHGQQHTGVPQWTVTLLEHPGDACPARCEAGRRYAFGPDTPAGFCVHASIVALTDGPLTWTDPDQRSMTTVCPHCDTPIRITLAGEQT